MAFKLPDLIVESIIRDGLNNARRDETVIEDVFSDLTKSFASKKYGQSEIEKIKSVIQNKEVSIVHAFNLVSANVPCISIHLSGDLEDQQKVQMGGYIYNIERPLTSPEELAKLVIVPAFTPDTYDPLSGIVKVPDSVNLVLVYANLLFVDANGTKHKILGGIINEPGEKQFIIEKGATVSLGSSATIQSSIDSEIFQRRANAEKADVTLGIHTKDALLTKYLYILTKYFLLSRRMDMVNRGYELSTYNGSDFQRNMEYAGDVVYSRFLTVSGTLLNQWRSDKVQLIDSVDVKVKVAKDRLGNEALNLTNMTVQVKE